jgi:prevent-host-death family protein
MAKTISLREANQALARCIRAVESGREFIITRRGQPVARLSSMSDRRVLTPEQEAAVARMNQIMEEGWDIGAGPLDRDELHEFYSAVTRKRILLAPRAATLAETWLTAFPCTAASDSAVRRALTEASLGRASYWDALLIATAAEAGRRLILSEDMADGDILGEVEIHNPFARSGGLTERTRALLGSSIA